MVTTKHIVYRKKIKRNESKHSLHKNEITREEDKRSTREQRDYK